jgi:hypothetical protein
MKNPKTVSITAKCSDLFSALLIGTNESGQPVTQDYDGYVPDFMPGQHYGDYVELNIDLATGRITNWKKPTARQLAATFKGPDSVSSS